jgi:citrate lyase subunit beta/citryl-CoA lyase
MGPHRSYLYVAGHRSDRIDKAYAGEVDAIVLELEDGVAPSKKEAARRNVAEFLTSTPPKPTYVRVNQVATGLLLDDLIAVAVTELDGIRLPKAESARDVQFVATLLDELGSAATITALLETAAAVESVAEIARAHPRLVSVGLGEQDLQADVGATGDDALLYARSRVVFASRAAGLQAPTQSVYPAIRDLDGLRADCLRGRRLGYFGRSAVHPAQVPVINEAYTPTAAEVADAEAMEQQLAAAVDAGEGGLKLSDGRFVDRATVLAARRSATFGHRGSSLPGSS